MRRNTMTRKARLFVQALEVRLTPSFSEFIDPNPNALNNFGSAVLTLSTGNVAVVSQFDDAGGTNAGAVYLFNGATGALISTLRGSTAFDNVGSGGLIAVGDGNFLIRSPAWDNGGIADVGAVTWVNGKTGLTGVVSAANSLIGSTAADSIGNTINVLTNGNYLVRSSTWDNGTVVDAGAITWGNGNTGRLGVVSSANSLVSPTANGGVATIAPLELANGNFVFAHNLWDSPTGVADVGAVTWGSGTAGFSGVMGPANSLVGSTAADSIGATITVLPNGNYIASSTLWNGGADNVGAVTWCNGDGATFGVVSAANSLVGSTLNDIISSFGITVLKNGNALVRSPVWDNGAATKAGAVTFVNGATGLVGAVSAANSLVGSASNDNIGASTPTLLTNGNYVINSNLWDNAALDGAGAATWGSGVTGVVGAISAANSLVGDSPGDNVGNSVTALPNGNYIVVSFGWDDAAANVGAVTWCNGATGRVGAVAAANSLVGSTVSDSIGNVGVQVLANGNAVARSPNWDNVAIVDAGAVTFINANTGLTGAVSNANSFVGSTLNDFFGNQTIVALANGNYVILNAGWDNGVFADAGSVTLCSGVTGLAGTVTAGNSLFGSTANDNVGSAGVTALTNGNYVVRSANWDNGAVVDVGALTWGSGTAGVVGSINAGNSLIGSKNGDFASGTITPLPNGNYVVDLPFWDNGAAADAGAVALGSGTAALAGVVGPANSLVGSANDQVGSSGITVLANGNYVVSSPFWDNGAAAADAGAVTWGSRTAGVVGAVSAANSLVGTVTNSTVGSSGVTVLANGNYVVRSSNWNNGSAVVGAATFGDGTTGVVGAVSAANSLVGSTLNDGIGGTVLAFADGDYAVIATTWDNGTLVNAGAVAWGSRNTGVSGVVSAANALVGLVANSALSSTINTDTVNGTFSARFTSEGTGRVRVGSITSGIIPNLTTAYVSTAFAALTPGTAIADADSGTAGNQPAVAGESAFGTIAPALVHLVDGGTLALVVGTYAENIAMTRNIKWRVGAGGANLTGIVSGPFGFVKTGNGQINLSGVNTFTGDVVVERGTLSINQDASLGNTANPVLLTGLSTLFVLGSFTTSRSFDLGGGKLQLNVGNTLTLNGATIVNGVITATSTVTGTISTTGNASTIQNATIAPNINLLLNVTNDMVQQSTNSGTITGAAMKTIQLDQVINTATSVLTANGTFTITDFETLGQITVNSGGLINSFAPTPVTLGGGSVTTIASGGGFTVNANGARVAGGLVKNSGNFGGAGTITVDYNGRVQGTGTFGSVVTQNGGVFAPGASPGTATTNQFNLNGGGRLEFEVANATGTPGVVSGWDLVNVQPTVFSATGLMNYTSTPTSKYTILLNSRLNDGIGNTPGNAANFNSAVGFAWKFADGSNANTSSSGTFDATNFSIDTSGFSNTVTGSFGVELRDAGKNLYVVYTPAFPPKVAGFVINSGNAQRSRVTTVTLDFDSVVSFVGAPESAFSLKRQSDNATPLLSAAVTNNTATHVTLTFLPGAAVDFASLADGRYTLTIDASKVSNANGQLDGDGNGTGGDNYVLASAATPNPPTNIFRIFGDSDGDGSVAANDFIAFRLALGGTSATFDFDNDGAVAASDFIQFRLRFGGSI